MILLCLILGHLVLKLNATITSCCPQCTLPLGLVENVEPDDEFDIYIHEPMISNDDNGLGLYDDFHNLDDPT